MWRAVRPDAWVRFAVWFAAVAMVRSAAVAAELPDGFSGGAPNNGTNTTDDATPALHERCDVFASGQLVHFAVEEMLPWDSTRIGVNANCALVPARIDVTLANQFIYGAKWSDKCPRARVVYHEEPRRLPLNNSKLLRPPDFGARVTEVIRQVGVLRRRGRGRHPRVRFSMAEFPWAAGGHRSAGGVAFAYALAHCKHVHLHGYDSSGLYEKSPGKQIHPLHDMKNEHARKQCRLPVWFRDDEVGEALAASLRRRLTDDGETTKATTVDAFEEQVANASSNVHLVFRSTEPRRLADAARNGAVAVTSADGRYAFAVHRLAAAVVTIAKIPALIVVSNGPAFDNAFESPIILEVRLQHANGDAALLPERNFCLAVGLKRWGWRSTQLHKTWAYALVLAQGLDVLLIDADWAPVLDPFPGLWSKATDVVAVSDAPWHKGQYLNFGLVWTKSNAKTIQLAFNVAEATRQMWDQAVWNAALSSSAASSSADSDGTGNGTLSCCVDAALFDSFRKDGKTHTLKDVAAVSERDCASVEMWNVSGYRRNSRFFNPCAQRKCP
ncbi:hypothetical protein M885DRAFT_589587 [Pelagophyceae sp. CCMP2097]|nr:hypothetical protein M885DRAFT_589587 [Pelagophyceae sp. CCMP2097]